MLGEMCDLNLDLTCGTGIAQINVTGGDLPVRSACPVERSTWGQIKTQYPK